MSAQGAAPSDQAETGAASGIEAALSAYIDFLQTVTPERVTALKTHVAADVVFEDPFHTSQGDDAMVAIFARTFESIPGARLDIHNHAVTGDTAFFYWTFSGQVRGKPWSVTGVTRLTFDARHKVTAHVEYWDAARHFYEDLPVIGLILRMIRRHISGG